MSDYTHEDYEEFFAWLDKKYKPIKTPKIGRIAATSVLYSDWLVFGVEKSLVDQLTDEWLGLRAKKTKETAQSAQEYVADRIKKEDGCWTWQLKDLNITNTKWAKMHDEYYAHRLAYVLANGAIEGNLQSLCDNKMCVNPDHFQYYPKKRQRQSEGSRLERERLRQEKEEANIAENVLYVAEEWFWAMDNSGALDWRFDPPLFNGQVVKIRGGQ